MAKIKTIIICICTLLAVHCNGQQDSLSCITQTYLSQIGIREATGRNDGEQVEAYLKSVGRHKGDAWCAAFVHWTLEQCDMPRVKSGWSPSWFPSSKVIYQRQSQHNQTPESGDVFGIWFQKLKRIAHVGFIDQWQNDWVTTVEGNTNEAGSREGDGVYKKRRLNRQIYKVARWKK